MSPMTHRSSLSIFLITLLAFGPLAHAAPMTETRLTLHPEELQYAQANSSDLNLEDLGFKSQDTTGDASYQKLLNRRTKMLKTHQILGLATGVAMALALSKASGTGVKGPAGKDAREEHEKFGLATGALYLTTASFAIFAPELPNEKKSGRTKLHRALAYIHFPAMLATAYLGITDKKKLDRGEDASGLKPAAATIAAVSYYTAMAVMIIPFGGGK